MTGKEKIKVAFFTDVLKENLDGVTYTIYNIIERIPQDKFDFLFITPFPPSKHVKLPFPVIVCRFMRMPLYKDYPLAIPYFDKKLKRALEEFKPDLLHFTTPSFLGRYALKYGKENNIPVVSTYHTHFATYVEYYFKQIPGVIHFFQPIAHFILRWYYRQCDVLLVPTDPVKQDLVDIGINGDRIKIWGRGIDIGIYNPGNRDKEYIDSISDPGKVRILFVSRLYWVKEIRTLVGLYKHLSQTRSDWTMIITGDGPQRKYMEKRMPEAVFTGKLIGKDLARIYASCDLFVFPSITETFGNVVLEAMASGLPVVAAAKGGPKGIVQEGVTGLLAKPKNSEDFFQKISSLLDNPKVLKEMSENAAAYARTQKWDTLCADLFKTYEEVAKHHQKISGDRNEIAV